MTIASAHIDLIARDRQFRSAMSRVNAVMGKVVARMQRVSAAAKRMLLVGGAALVGFLKLAADQEAAERALELALDANGFAVDAWAGKLKRASEEIQRLTVHGDETVQQFQAMALNFGIAAEKVDDVVRAAIGLSVSLKQDVKIGLKQMSQALAGNFMMLNRYIPALRTVTSDTEKMAIVLEFARRGFKQAEGEVSTFTGQLIQMKNALGDVGEVIGGLFIGRVTSLTTKLKDALPVFGAWIKRNAEIIITVSKIATVVLAVTAGLPALALGIKIVTGTLVLLKFAAIKATVALAAMAANPIITAITILAAAVGGLVIQIKLADALLNSFRSQLERIGMLNDSLDRLEDIFASIDASQLEKIQENLQKQISTVGLLILEDDRYVLVLEGLEKRLERVNQKLREREIAQRAVAESAEKDRRRVMELQAAVDDYTKSLIIQIRTLGLSSEEAEIFKLKLRGATDEQLAGARAAATLLANLQNLQIDLAKGPTTPAKPASVTATPKIAGRVEDLRSTFRRIQESAAGDVDKTQAKIAQASVSTANSVAESVKKQEVANRKLQEIIAALTIIPVLGLFGP